jgi:hypothetical protein
MGCRAPSACRSLCRSLTALGGNLRRQKTQLIISPAATVDAPPPPRQRTATEPSVLGTLLIHLVHMTYSVLSRAFHPWTTSSCMGIGHGLCSLCPSFAVHTHPLFVAFVLQHSFSYSGTHLCEGLDTSHRLKLILRRAVFLDCIQ